MCESQGGQVMVQTGKCRKCGHSVLSHIALDDSQPCGILQCTCEDYAEKPQPPQVAAKRPTPELVQREVRKFALEQAIKMMPYLRGGTTAEEVAAIYEDYILNGKADK